MTTFRYKMLAAVIFACAFAGDANAQQPRRATCNNVDPFAERACVSRRVEAKDHRLEEFYSRPLNAVQRNAAKYGRDDSRSNVTYLVRSQAAWKQFVHNDCKVRAAFGGGSNPSISEREIGCYENALDERLGFLGKLADGSFGSG